MIPLSAVAKFSQGATPLSVNHQGLLVANTISFNLPPGVSLSDAVATIDSTGGSFVPWVALAVGIKA